MVGGARLWGCVVVVCGAWRWSRQQVHLPLGCLAPELPAFRQLSVGTNTNRYVHLKMVAVICGPDDPPATLLVVDTTGYVWVCVYVRIFCWLIDWLTGWLPAWRLLERLCGDSLAGLRRRCGMAEVGF